MSVVTCYDCGEEFPEEVQSCPRCGISTKDRLIHAVGTGHIEVVSRLLKSGADVNARDERGRTALVLACRQGHTDIVRELVKHGSDVDVKDNSGWTPLMWAAASTGDAEAIELLLDHGANPNVKDQCGSTPLMKACRQRFWHGGGIALGARSEPQYQGRIRPDRAHESCSAGTYDAGETVAGGRRGHGSAGSVWSYRVDGRGS